MKRTEIRRQASEMANLLEDGAELNYIEVCPVCLRSALGAEIISFMRWCLENKGRMTASQSKIDEEAANQHTPQA